MFSQIQRLSVCARAQRTVLPTRTVAFARPQWRRGFASATANDPSKPKPKASTPLRRAAAASQPIRSNPTPTRSQIQSVFTLSTAESYVLSRLRTRLPASAQTLHEAWWIPQYGEGEIFVFPNNGSVVCWGLTEEEAKKFARQVLSFPEVQVGALKEAETEQLDFITDPSEQVRLAILLHNDSQITTGQPDYKVT